MLLRMVSGVRVAVPLMDKLCFLCLLSYVFSQSFLRNVARVFGRKGVVRSV